MTIHWKMWHSETRQVLMITSTTGQLREQVGHKTETFGRKLVRRKCWGARCLKQRLLLWVLIVKRHCEGSFRSERVKCQFVFLWFEQWSVESETFEWKAVWSLIPESFDLTSYQNLKSISFNSFFWFYWAVFRKIQSNWVYKQERSVTKPSNLATLKWRMKIHIRTVNQKNDARNLQSESLQDD